MADLRHTPKTYHSFMKARKVATASRHRFLYAIVFAEFMQDNYGYNIRVSGRKCGDVCYGFDSHGMKIGPGFMISVYRPPRNGGDQERYFPMNVSHEDMERAFHNFARNLIFNRIPTDLQIPGWTERVSYPESYESYKNSSYDTWPNDMAINAYAEEFAGFCEDYTGTIPLAYMQVTACFVSCHIRIRTGLNSYTRSIDFSPVTSKEHRFAVYKKFIDESLIHIWHMKHFYRDRYSIS